MLHTVLGRQTRWMTAAVFVWLFATTASFAQRGLTPTGLRQHPAIKYDTAPVHDAVTELSRKVHAGEVKLEYEPVSGYLRSVLKALDIPIESQILVFSKTSFQAPKIRPDNPRAIYFNDQPNSWRQEVRDELPVDRDLPAKT